MAITKIRPITATLKKAIDYIRDLRKTNGGMLVSSFGCAPETADLEFKMTRNLAYDRQDEVIARHLIQSFAIGEVTPEQAHQIGKEFADEVLGGKYEYVIATHIDKDHFHNHIIFNNVDIVTHRRYRSNKFTYHQIQKINDRICKDHGLSIVEDPIPRNKKYKEWEHQKQGTSWKAKLQNKIDECVETSKDFSDFISQMKAAGYEFEEGKHLKFRAPGQERFTRADTIGEDYTKEAIEDRIAGTYTYKKRTKIHEERPIKKRNTVYRTSIHKINLLVDLQARTVANSRGYEHAMRIRNIKNMANTLNFLSANGVTHYSQLSEQIDKLDKEFAIVHNQIKEAEAKLKKMSEVINAATKYQQLRPVAEQYKKAWNKKKFYSEHESELIIFEAAKEELHRNGITKMPYVVQLRKDYSNLESRKDILSKQYRQCKIMMENFKNTKANVDKTLHRSRVDRNQEQKKTKTRQEKS